MTKKQKIMLGILGLLLVLVLLWGFITALSPVKFYNDFPFRLVSKETKAFVKSLYREYSNSLRKMWVAEDTRSEFCARLAFFSKEPLPEAEQTELLERIRDRAWYQDDIEVFFCMGQEVYAVYAAVSPPRTARRQVREYSPWERIPKAEAALDVSLVERMMKQTSIGMFDAGHDLPPLSECKPDLPPYAGDYDYQRS